MNLEYKLNKDKSSVKRIINQQTQNTIITVDEEDFINKLFNQFAFDNITLKDEEVYINSNPTYLPIAGSLFPRSHHKDSDQMYQELCIIYKIPYLDPSEVLIFSEGLGDIIDEMNKELSITIPRFERDKTELDKAASDSINHIKENVNQLNEKIKQYNKELLDFTCNTFKERKSRLIEDTQFLEQLSVPLKRRQNVSTTFSIPLAKKPKKIKYEKPKYSKEDIKPNLILGLDVYEAILKCINDVGKQLERMPSLYKDKDEETLRDFFLLFLEPNFEGSTTGETFNKEGKTDILHRYNGENAFVAECKIWDGKVKLYHAIDQLFNKYLTWRDNKAAIILFVKTQDMTKIVNTG